MRAEHTGSATDSAVFRVDIDGNDTGIRVTVGNEDAFEWTFGPDATDESGLTAGSHTVRYTLIENPSNVEVLVDNIAIYDERYSASLDFPDTLDTNQQLNGPQLYRPEQLLQYPDDFTTAFSFVRGDITASMENVSNNQFVGISFDRGETFQRNQNSETIDTTPASASASIRFEINLSRYGSRTDETPTEGYEGQTIESVIVEADVEQTLLLLNRDFDASLTNVLNEIAGEYEFVWSTISPTTARRKYRGRNRDSGLPIDPPSYPSVCAKSGVTRSRA